MHTIASAACCTHLIAVICQQNENQGGRGVTVARKATPQGDALCLEEQSTRPKRQRCESKHAPAVISPSFSFLSSPPSFPNFRPPLRPRRSLIQQQMMQQQAALMAATQGSYLNPMAAIAAAQMQQMAAFNVNGLVATPMTPSSGMRTEAAHQQGGGTLNDFTDARAGAPLSISHCWPGTFSSLVRIIEAARNIFIKGLSAPALVTFLRCGLHLQ